MTLITFQGFGHVSTVGHDNLNQRRMRENKAPEEDAWPRSNSTACISGVGLAEALGVRLEPELISEGPV